MYSYYYAQKHPFFLLLINSAVYITLPKFPNAGNRPVQKDSNGNACCQEAKKSNDGFACPAHVEWVLKVWACSGFRYFERAVPNLLGKDLGEEEVDWNSEKVSG